MADDDLLVVFGGGTTRLNAAAALARAQLVALNTTVRNLAKEMQAAWKSAEDMLLPKQIASQLCDSVDDAA